MRKMLFNRIFSEKVYWKTNVLDLNEILKVPSYIVMSGKFNTYISFCCPGPLLLTKQYIYIAITKWLGYYLVGNFVHVFTANVHICNIC